MTKKIGRPPTDTRRKNWNIRATPEAIEWFRVRRDDIEKWLEEGVSPKISKYGSFSISKEAIQTTDTHNSK